MYWAMALLIGCLLLLQPARIARAEEAGPADQAQQSTRVGVGRHVVVTANVRPVWLLVTDDSGELLEVWTNTDAPADLQARSGSVRGPAAPVSAAARATFEQIAPLLPAGGRGRVYRRMPGG